MTVVCLALLFISEPGTAELQQHLFALHEKVELSQQDEVEAIDLLSSADDDIFGLAAYALHRGKTQASIDALNAFIGSTSAWRAFTATSALIDRGVTVRYFGLRARLLSIDEPAMFRRQLAWKFDGLDYDPRDALRAYVEIMSSEDVGLRYVASRTLARYGAPLSRDSYRTSTRRSTTKALTRWIDSLPADWKPDRSYIGRVLCGVGARFDHSSGPPVIAAVTPGLPAARGGVESGMTLLAVDGDSVDQKLPYELMHYEITGACGTMVHLKLKRPNGTVVNDLLLNREPLRVPSP